MVRSNKKVPEEIMSSICKSVEGKCGKCVIPREPESNIIYKVYIVYKVSLKPPSNRLYFSDSYMLYPPISLGKPVRTNVRRPNR